MAYRPRSSRNRDKAYPSEVAAMRPMLAPRIHCEEPYEEFDGENTIRGSRSESMCERFNHSLRSGHGFRNEGEDNE